MSGLVHWCAAAAILFFRFSEREGETHVDIDCPLSKLGQLPGDECRSRIRDQLDGTLPSRMAGFIIMEMLY